MTDNITSSPRSELVESAVAGINLLRGVSEDKRALMIGIVIGLGLSGQDAPMDQQ